MKKRLISLALLSVGMYAETHAQQRIYYGYDAAGNRTTRTAYNIYQLRSVSNTPDDDGEETNALASEWRMLVAPNPTHGFVQVLITGMGDPSQCTLTVVSAFGQSVLLADARQGITTLDLSALADGLYILRTDIDGTIMTAKIIKEN